MSDAVRYLGMHVDPPGGGGRGGLADMTLKALGLVTSRGLHSSHFSI
jgi:hypothetical protein